MSDKFIHGIDIRKDGTIVNWMRLKDNWWNEQVRTRWINYNIPKAKIEDFENSFMYNLFDYLEFFQLTCMHSKNDPIHKFPNDFVYTEETYDKLIHFNHDFPETLINLILGIMSEISNDIKIDVIDLLPKYHLALFIDNYLDNKFNKNSLKEAFRDYLSHLDINITMDKYKSVDDSVIDIALNEVIEANPEQFIRAKDDPKLVNWFLGQTMKKLGGKAPAQDIKNKIMERLNE